MHEVALLLVADEAVYNDRTMYADDDDRGGEALKNQNKAKVLTLGSAMRRDVDMM